MKHSTTHNIFLEIGKSHSFHFFLKQRKFLFLRFFLFIFISIFSINTNFAIEYKNLSSTILFGNEKLRPLIQRCGKPTNLQVTNITSTSAKISWTGVSGARRYRILYKKVGAPRFKIKQVNTTSINITGLKPATNYIFFVRSYCSWYNIGRSVKGTFRTLDGCDKPTNLSVEEITSTSAKLIWSKIDSATDYIIEYKKFTGAINWKQIGPFPATDSFYIITSLLPDTKYAWRVKAKCPDGTTEFGNISNFTTLPLGDCPKPINLSVTSITSSSALLNWNLVSGSNGYIIKYKKKSAANWITIDSIDPSINSYQLNGLLPNTIYTYKVQSICPQGSSFFSQPKDFTTLGLGPCDIPSAITVSNISTTSATISWTGDVEATSYELQYKEISNPNWQSVIINAPTTTYTFSNLIQNTTYQYRLKTVCPFGESNFSSISEFTTLTAPVCDVPSAIAVSNISTTSATISWTGDVEATSYELQYKELSNPNWQSVIINAPTTTYTFSNLIQNTTYQYRLKTVCSFGESVFSSIGEFTTLTAPVCDVPSAIAVSNISTTSATISWTGDVEATSYELQYKELSNPNWQSVIINAPTTTYTFSNLIQNTTYQYRLKTVCSFGESVFSSIGEFTTLTAPVCDVPSAIAVSNISTTSATISWTGDIEATSYELQYKELSNPNWQSVIINAPTTTYSFSNLIQNTTYQYRLKTVCSFGESVFSSIGEFTTLTAPVCDIPSAITVSNISTTSATISWTGDVEATSYELQYKELSNPNWQSVIINAPTTTYTFSNLIQNTTYQYRLKTVCSFGESVFSSIGEFTTLTAPVCDIPSAITVSNISTTSATISWTGDIEATSYELQYKELSNPNWQSVIINAPTTTYTFSNLLPNTTYQYRLKTVCPFGESNFSSISEFTTLTAPVCDIPSAITVNNISTTSATISWTGDIEATSYELQYKELSNPNWQSVIINAPTTTYTFSNLLPNTTYQYRLKTVCSFGESVFSSIGEFTTLTAPVCDVPSAITVSNISTTSATISWTGDIEATSYELQYKELSNPNWQSVIINAPTTTYTFSNLLPNTTYQYRLKTVCSFGESVFSSIGEFTTLTAPVCDVPSAITVSNINTTSATITWTGDVEATSYELQYKELSNPNWQSVIINAPTTTYTFSNLIQNTTYQYRLKTVCPFGESVFSSIGEFTTLPFCNEPFNLTLGAINCTDATLSWQSNAQNLSFVVSYKPLGFGTWQNENTPISSIQLFDLLENTTYEFKVKAICSFGESNFSNIVNFTTEDICQIPFDLIVTNITETAATLIWNGASNTIIYEVFYKKLSDPNWLIGNTSDLFLFINNLTPNTTYEFKVKAYCPSCESIESDPFLFTTLQICPVATGLNANNINCSSASLTWSGPNGVNAYVVQYRPIGGVWITENVPDNYLDLYNLAANTNYEFKVKSICSLNESNYSGAYNFTTSPACNTPNLINTSFITSTAATIDWQSNINANEFQVYYRPINTPTWLIESVPFNFVDLINLIPNTTYEFKIKAFCNGCESNFSNIITFTTLVDCTEPSGLVANDITCTTANLTWSGPNGALSYIVKYREIGGIWTEEAASDNYYDLINLESGTTYEYIVKSICGQGESLYSTAFSFDTDPTCSDPINLSATLITTTTAKLTWTQNSGANEYEILYKPVNDPNWISDFTTNLFLNISNLLPNTLYEFKVKAYCDFCESDFSATANFTTLLQCEIPTNINVQNITCSTAKITWNNPANSQSFLVQYRLSGNWIEITTSQNFVDLINLNPNSNYEFRVKTICTSGESNFSNIDDFTTTIGCTPPSDLSANDITCSAASLTWFEPNGTDSFNIEYRISGNWISVNSTQNFLDLINLSPGTTYEYRVKSYCNLCESNFSPISTFTTANICEIPSDLAANDVSCSTASLTWFEANGTNSFIVQYRILGNPNWITETADDNFIDLVGLTQNSTYQYKIKGICTSCESDYSIINTFFTASDCGVPVNLISSNITCNEATITWTGAPNTISYVLSYKNVNDPNWTEISTTDNFYNFSGLSLGTTYQVRIKGICALCESAYSATISFSTIPDCGVPQNITISNIANNTAQLNWDLACGATNYEIKYRVIGNPLFQNGSSSVNFYNFQNLIPGSDYEVKIRTDCNGVYSDFSAYLNFTTLVMRLSNPNPNPKTKIEPKIEVYPNPNNGTFKLKYIALTEDEYLISLFNLAGQTIQESKFEATIGENEMDFNLVNVPRGLYFISISNKENRTIQKIIIE